MRALDHANIFVLIAGTYTPLCFNVLEGWPRPTLLTVIWLCAVVGVALATLTLRAPRWLTAALYVGMGWVSVFALPAFVHALSWPPVLVLFGGGVLYTIGAVVYAQRWPNPFPRCLWLPRGVPSLRDRGQHRVCHHDLDMGRAVPAWLAQSPLEHV